MKRGPRRVMHLVYCSANHDRIGGDCALAVHECPPPADEALRDWQRALLSFDADGQSLDQVVADMLGVKSVNLRTEQDNDGNPTSEDRRWRVQYFGGTYGGTVLEVLASHDANLAAPPDVLAKVRAADHRPVLRTLTGSDDSQIECICGWLWDDDDLEMPEGVSFMRHALEAASSPAETPEDPDDERIGEPPDPAIWEGLPATRWSGNAR